ncbi:hypothetical protein EV356DRAFT_501985 [Viridothelium virens]|uniref:Glycoside hydrolase family 43 protein n=1 Tax=Viridothelium virens TaxID=1048519 RepID=A0A6A6H8S5_VIRVR|nr:hypothetical protein EV356DRAFT_501985 [Viridothelium virens]
MYWSFLFLAGAAAAQTPFSTPNWQGLFAAGSGVLESLKPTTDLAFDFSPSDVFSTRNGNGNSHTGDISFRYRLTGQNDWIGADSATNRVNITSTEPQDSTGLLESDLDSLWPNVSSQLHVTRLWTQYQGDVILNFTLANVADTAIELGALGLAIEMNNIFINRTADETMQDCVLLDPYIGLGAGYVQVTRLTGTGPDMVITPFGNLTKFEAWRFLPERNNPYYQQQTYEGNYAYEIYTKAYAEQEWNATTPWNTPTSAMISPGESISVALRFSATSSVDQIEDAVASNDVPVAVGIPGYVLPHDIVGSLYINSSEAIQSMTVSPENGLSVSARNETLSGAWQAYEVLPSQEAFGRTRLDITYASGRTQAIHYYITNTGPDTLQNAGNFLTTKQWYTNTSDPFHRAPSVISYDYSVGNYVLQDNRAWIAGISDEGGAGSFLAAGMKQFIYPSAGEVAKLEQMVNETVWGYLQISSGPQKYAVRKSLFFYQPSAVPGYQYNKSINWNGAWNEAAAYATDRAYDYVHVSALYWSLYHAGRTTPGILTLQTPLWYLNQSYNTVAYTFGTSANGAPNTGYGDDGLMGETVWSYLLDSLRIENLTAEATNMESLMRARQRVWASETDPFGSEMAWDSTGQEGVYLWSTYFNDSTTANKSLNSIRGYMPTVPHWAWNGNARRYWDFLYAGKIPQIERQIHHYGSGLNSLPLLASYRSNPQPGTLKSLYDLRVAFGGNMGPLSNVRQDGSTSLAMHSYPELLEWDPYSGDYGPNFSGMVMGAGTYLVDHPVFGMVSFGGNIVSNMNANGNGDVTVQPRDAVRRRIFIAPLGLYVTFSAGAVQEFTYEPSTGALTVSVGKAQVDQASNAINTIMNFEQTSSVLGSASVTLATSGLTMQQGGYLVNLPSNGTTTLTFSKTSN